MSSSEIRRLETQIELLNAKVQKSFEYIDKILNISSRHFDTHAHRSARPYYPLDNKWGLTSLDTGAPFFVNTEDRNITPWIIMGGHWETNVDRVLCTYAKPGMKVLDIGAHMGYYTVKLGRIIGSSGRLFSFEPNPEVNAVCEENIKLNGLNDRATLHKFALGDTHATATLTRSHSNMASANLIGEQDADYSVEVEVRPLDDSLPADLSVDLIKLDAEGYERKILEGAKGVFARSPNCAVVIELGLERWERAAPLDDLVNACGGGGREIFAVGEKGDLTPMSPAQIRPFLLTCGYHENYFLIATRADVERNAAALLV